MSEMREKEEVSMPEMRLFVFYCAVHPRGNYKHNTVVEVVHLTLLPSDL
jgi:hypothetical protein